MSEKHLTEPPWKLLVGKHGVKDLGLGKALVEYGKLDSAKAPALVLEALKEITELAVKLKKANAGKDDVVAHLDEIAKEVKKTTPALEAKVKSAAAAAEAAAQVKPAEAPAPAKPAQPAKPKEDDDAAEETEAAAFKKDLKKQMVNALAQVKARAPGDPEQEKEPKPQLRFMAYLAGAKSAVIISRMVGSATKKVLQEIANGANGGKYVQGECIFEQNNHTFVLPEVPGGLAKKLATALHAETGQKCKVRVRNTDGSFSLDSDTDVDPDAEKTAATSAAATGDEMAKFTARFKALQPDMVKAIGTKTPQGDEIRKRAADAGALANKKDFPQANKGLDELEVLVKKVLATPIPPAPAAPAKPAAAPAAASEQAGPRRQIKLSTYLTGRANLRAARENAAKELQRLQQVILAKASDESFFKEIEAKSQRLFEYLAPIDDSVANKLDEAGRCPDPEQQDELNNKVRELIQKQLTSLRNHRLASFVQTNPFGKFIIRQPLEVTLSALDKQLS